MIKIIRFCLFLFRCRLLLSHTVVSQKQNIFSHTCDTQGIPPLSLSHKLLTPLLTQTNTSMPTNSPHTCVYVCLCIDHKKYVKCGTKQIHNALHLWYDMDLICIESENNIKCCLTSLVSSNRYIMHIKRLFFCSVAYFISGVPLAGGR